MKRLTPEDWRRVLSAAGVRPQTCDKWVPLFVEMVQPASFNMGFDELDDFTAQTLHETANLERLVEDLNYRPETLQRVWPARFPSAARAIQFAYQPEKLANEVYGGRLGNEAYGDGWKYRGRGIPMVTGKDNYALLQSMTGEPLVDFPVMLESPRIALRCGLLWWERKIPDDAIDSIERQTRIVNGGLVGLEDRRSKYRQAHNAMEPMR